jgi:hypothetical protein
MGKPYGRTLGELVAAYGEFLVAAAGRTAEGLRFHDLRVRHEALCDRVG